MMINIFTLDKPLEHYKKDLMNILMLINLIKIKTNN